MPKKLSHCEMILKFFEDNNGSVTLGGFLEAGRYSYAHKLTARLSDLRRQGFSIQFKKGKSPIHNIYTLISLSTDAMAKKINVYPLGNEQ